MKKKTTKQKKAQFIIATNELGEMTIAIQGKRINLLEAISFAAYEDENVMELLMDSVLAAVAIHMKKEHNIDLVDYIESKMEENLSKYKKPKERIIN